MLQFKGHPKLYTTVILLSTVGYFLCLMVPWLDNDLWSDEFYTLKWFSLVPFKTTVTDYHSSNHTLYNIFNYCYLRVLGINSMTFILEHPWIMRLPLLLVALASLLLIYRAGKLISGTLAGVLGVAILTTDIPFQNYCLQLRGYGFTVFFDLLLLFTCLRYLQYKKRTDLVLMAFAAFAAVYSVSSNLYCVVGVLAFFSVEFLYDLVKEKTIVSSYWKPMVAVLIGLAIALLCFSPGIKEVFTSPFVSRKAPAFRLSNINDATFFYGQLVEGRRLLYAFFLLALLIYFTPIIAGLKRISETWRFVFWQFVAPVVIVAGMGQHPPARIFIYLSVYLALLVAVTLVHVIRFLLPRPYPSVIVALLTIYLICVCQRDKAAINEMMSPDVIHPVIHQDLRANYCLNYYNPLKVSHYLAKQDTQSCPVILYKAAYLHCYLETLHVPFYSSDSLDQFLDTKGKVFLSTIYPVEIDSAFLAIHRCEAREILPRSFDHLFILERR